MSDFAVITRPLLEVARFFSKVETTSTGCMDWKCGQNRNGYGRFWITSKRYEMAHIYLFRLWIGVYEEGKLLDHLCRRRVCVNPYHLEPVSVRRNTLRGNGPTAAKWRGDDSHKVVHASHLPAVWSA